jgi:hypothetical protein
LLPGGAAIYTAESRRGSEWDSIRVGLGPRFPRRIRRRRLICSPSARHDVTYTHQLGLKFPFVCFPFLFLLKFRTIVGQRPRRRGVDNSTLSNRTCAGTTSPAAPSRVHDGRLRRRAGTGSDARASEAPIAVLADLRAAVASLPQRARRCARLTMARWRSCRCRRWTRAYPPVRTRTSKSPVMQGAWHIPETGSGGTSTAWRERERRGSDCKITRGAQARW